MKTGIYKILNIITNDFYIGSACNYYNRKSKHLGMLRRNLHNNKHLQNAYNKYKEESFKFILIEECLKENLYIREQWYIDNLKPNYNICLFVEGRLGLFHEQSTKDKIKESVTRFHKEKGLSKESKEKIANTLKGRKHSKETIEKRRQANIKAWELKKLKNGL